MARRVHIRIRPKGITIDGIVLANSIIPYSWGDESDGAIALSIACCKRLYHMYPSETRYALFLSHIISKLPKKPECDAIFDWEFFKDK